MCDDGILNIPACVMGQVHKYGLDLHMPCTHQMNVPVCHQIHHQINSAAGRDSACKVAGRIQSSYCAPAGCTRFSCTCSGWAYCQVLVCILEVRQQVSKVDGHGAPHARVGISAQVLQHGQEQRRCHLRGHKGRQLSTGLCHQHAPLCMSVIHLHHAHVKTQTQAYGSAGAMMGTSRWHTGMQLLQIIEHQCRDQQQVQHSTCMLCSCRSAKVSLHFRYSGQPAASVCAWLIYAISISMQSIRSACAPSVRMLHKDTFQKQALTCSQA